MHMNSHYWSSINESAPWPIGLRLSTLMLEVFHHVNPPNAEATFVQSTGTQRFLKSI